MPTVQPKTVSSVSSHRHPCRLSAEEEEVNILNEGKMVDTHLDALNHTAYPTWTMSMGSKEEPYGLKIMEKINYPASYKS
eukprot:1688247-Amphidinium_carterae.1